MHTAGQQRHAADGGNGASLAHEGQHQRRRKGVHGVTRRKAARLYRRLNQQHDVGVDDVRARAGDHVFQNQVAENKTAQHRRRHDHR